MKFAFKAPISRYFFVGRIRRTTSLRLNKDHRQAVWNGAPVNLPELSFQFLARLAASAPNPVTYDELVADVWAGVSVSQDAIKQRARLVREALGAAGADKAVILSVRGIGYRLAAPLAGKPKAIRGIAIAAATVGIALVLAWGLLLSRPYDDVAAQPHQPGAIVAVSTFSDDSDQHANKTLHMEMMAALGKLENVRVVSSQTMESLKDMRAKDIARETRASLVIEGSIRKQNGFNIIDLRIVDAETEIVIWSERYNTKMELSQKIAAHATRYIHDAAIWNRPNHRRAGSLSKTEARKLFTEALRVSYRGTREGLVAASALLAEALQHDHTFVEARARLAEFQARLALRFNEPEASQAAIAWAESALQLEPDAAIARYAYGLALQANGAKEAATSELRLAAATLPYAERDASAAQTPRSPN